MEQEGKLDSVYMPLGQRHKLATLRLMVTGSYTWPHMSEWNFHAAVSEHKRANNKCGGLLVALSELEENGGQCEGGLRLHYM